jgi:acetyl esterase/lipase
MRNITFWSLILSTPFWLTACSGVQILNNLAPRIGIERIADIDFQNKPHSLQLDIYRPTGNLKKDMPVVIFYWGGRWQEGDKSMYQFLGRELAKQGIITVIPNYRLWPLVGYKEFLNDSADALNWVHAQIENYSGDSNRIFVMGHSAGAYNAVMLALNTPFNPNPQRTLAGAIGISGPYDFLPFADDEQDLKQIFAPAKQYADSQPINWGDGKNAPLLLIHSLDDDIVYAKNSQNLAHKIQEHGGQAELLLTKNLSHAMSIGVVSNLLSWKAPTTERIIDFISKNRQHSQN